ncbi:diacylglycerol kinase family protein [Arthrobacter sp.]|uniref:diacylglycerol kinase family protein n=1 Tax=Arthrobacter sp. TaxID=1667 RepID=UPI0033933D38
MTSPPPAAPTAVAINPHAAFGTTARGGAEVVAELARRGRYALEWQAETGSALADVGAGELRRGICALLVADGDGMVHLAVNALAGTQVPPRIVPTGTGNDSARLFNLPAQPRTAVGHYLQALEQPRRVDKGRVTPADRTACWFAGVLSAGFDAAVNDRANRWRLPRGRLRYPLRCCANSPPSAP